MSSEKPRGISDLIGALRVSAEAVKCQIEDGSTPENEKVEGMDLLHQQINQIRTALLTERYGFGPESPDHLFVTHYTRLQTVKSILTAAAADTGDDAVLRRYSSSRFNDPEDGLLLLDRLDTDSAPDWLTPADPRPAYVASFVAPSDTLNEPAHPLPMDRLRYWRFYGDNGTGCSIYVRVARARLSRVLYGEKDIETTAAHLRKMCDALRGVLDPQLQCSPDYKRRIQHALESKVQDLLTTVRFLHKDEAYSDENECRVLDRTEEDEGTIHFSVGSHDDSMVEVRSFRTDADLVAHEIFTTGAIITIGPCVSHKEEVRAYFEHLLRRAGLQGHIVKISKESYRGSQ